MDDADDLKRGLDQWIQAEVEAGRGTREEIEAALVANPKLIPRRFVRVSAVAVFGIDENDEKTLAQLRGDTESLAFELMQRLPSEKQVMHLAALLERARDIDRDTAQLRGAITQLEKERPRLEVWRMLQARVSAAHRPLARPR